MGTPDPSPPPPDDHDPEDDGKDQGTQDDHGTQDDQDDQGKQDDQDNKGDRGKPLEEDGWDDHGIPHRFKRELMDHPSRQKMLDILGTRPGLNTNLLAVDLGIYYDVAGFHLRRLEALKMVERRKSPRKNEKVFFLPEDTHLWENPNTRILYGRSPLRQVGLYMAEHPGATSKQAARALGLSQMGVLYHIRTLRNHDLLDRLRVDRKVIYHPTEELQDWAETAGQGYRRSWENDDESE